jgi:limonene-1,2-epoxide hydrolase
LLQAQGPSRPSLCAPLPTCTKLHVHQLSICDDGDAALRHRVDNKLAVQVLVSARVTGIVKGQVASRAWLSRGYL